MKQQPNWKLLQGVAALLTLIPATAWAEGSVPEDDIEFVVQRPGQPLEFGANHGVNRTIRTRGQVVNPASRVQGFVGVKGNANLSFTMTAEANGDYSQLVNPLNNKPSIYLGGEVAKTAADGGGAVEIDSGVQFEPGTFSDVNALVAEPGWSVFHYVGPYRAPIRIYDGVNREGRAWRGGSAPNGQGSVGGTITFETTPQGHAKFSFSSMNTTVGTVTSESVWAIRWVTGTPRPANYYPTATDILSPWLDTTNNTNVVFNPALLKYSSMKRVVALTRPAASSSRLDGIEMTGAWSGCSLLPYVPPVVPPAVPPPPAPNGGWVTWNWQHVNQNRTGYDTRRTGPLSFDRRYNGQRLPDFSRRIVEFSTNPTLNATIDSAISEAMREHFVDATNRPSNYERYATERVRFNLGMVARPVGNAVE